MEARASQEPLDQFTPRKGAKPSSSPHLNHAASSAVLTRPAAHFGNPLAAHAELTYAPARISHRQHENPVAFPARAFRTVFGVSDRALQQRTTQQLPGDRQFADQLLARSERLLAYHSQE
jgi:hypothetical protein